MEYTVAHETTYLYPEPVRESYTVVHLQPRTDARQYCTAFSLRVTPSAAPRSYIDRFGNLVHHFAILPAHASLSIVARSRVVTTPAADPTDPLEATRAQLEAESLPVDLFDYRNESPYVHQDPEVAAFLRELPPLDQNIGRWCHGVAKAIHEGFTYDSESTTVHSTIAESLSRRAGVCQDFAHVMIAALRAARIPARYVSGYIFRGDSNVAGAEASHAWCEAYLPPFGWVGFDPTNDRLVDGHFVTIAFGRDYRDVSPVRGVYKGDVTSEMAVNVAMEALQSAQTAQ
jgi:transglutaminase-like putative cysteine protease